MRFVVETPDNRLPERRYALQVVLADMLGLQCEFAIGPAGFTRIHVPGEPGAIRIADHFFPAADNAWLSIATLPRFPLRHFRPPDEGLTPISTHPDVPVLYGAPGDTGAYIEHSPADIAFNVDIVGTAFFLLSGYEEIACPSRDAVNRFSFEASVLRNEDLIDRPVVDEYIELLWSAVERTWPRAERRPRSFRLAPSHDVDIPYLHAFTPLPRMLLSCAADVLKRSTVGGALRRVVQWRKARRGDISNDPANTFDYIMDESERRGVQSDFFFIVEHTNARMDGNYDIHHPWILGLMRHIADRGHRIGLHGSFDSYDRPEQIEREVGILRSVCEELGIDQPSIRARQHWLRWHNPKTLEGLDRAGVAVDATMTFAVRVGFRRGTSHSFRAFDLLKRAPLSVWHQPLLIMDATLVEPTLMNLGFGERPRIHIDRLRQAVRTFGGEFTVLWHNSRLCTPDERALYRYALGASVQ